MAGEHVPVMLREVLSALSPQENEVYVDATFGGGGYTAAFLNAAACRVIAFDRDPEAIVRAEALKQKFGERLTLIQAPFSQIRQCLEHHGIDRVNGVVFDIGVSSYQIDTPERGFSLRFDGPLHMRMDGDESQTTAYDVVNKSSEEELADIIYYYGEDRKSRAIARAIVNARHLAPIMSTLALADIVKKAMPYWHQAEHPATRTFQALRIFVNDELGELEQALAETSHYLIPGGRLVVVTFHSLEDSLVKTFLYPHTKDKSPRSRYLPEPKVIQERSPFQPLTRKPVMPQADEVRRNPRSRSAKLRAAIYQGEV